MTIAYRLVTFTIRLLTDILCKIDVEELQKVPEQGPLIFAVNHINFLDIPVVYTHLQPRPLTGLVKSETWDNPVLRKLFNIWGAIPIRRGEADLKALRNAIEALERRQIVAIAPEGTRSGTGVLTRAHPGIAMLALHSKAPILPLVYYGHERFRANIARLKRTPFHVRLGQAFTVCPPKANLTRALRQRITDEIMVQVAALLPETYRGDYADLNSAPPVHLNFI